MHTDKLTTRAFPAYKTLTISQHRLGTLLQCSSLLYLLIHVVQLKTIRLICVDLWLSYKNQKKPPQSRA